MMASAQHFKLYLLALLVAACTFYLYLPALDNGILRWDDQQYLADAAHFSGWDADTVTAFTSTDRMANWHPLTWLSLAFDTRLFKDNAWGYHLHNVLLHCANVILIFILTYQVMGTVFKRSIAYSPTQLQSARLYCALISSSLFAVHPQHVEVVAWISERKELLCAFFYLCCIITYMRFASAASKPKIWTWYLLSTLCAALAFMSKPMAVSIPVVLLLLDVYPLQRFQLVQGKPDTLSKSVPAVQLLREKVPFILLSLLCMYLTIIAQQQTGAIQTAENFPIAARVLNSANSIILYLSHLVAPFNLLPYYQYTEIMQNPGFGQWLPVLALFLAFGLSVYRLVKGYPAMIIIAAVYVVSLIPVLGFVQVGWQAAAERYAYIPTIPLYLLMGYVWIYVIFKPRNNWLFEFRAYAGISFITGLILIYALQTNNDIRVWKDDRTLWLQVDKLGPPSALAHNNLGVSYMNTGEYELALYHFYESLSVMPNQYLPNLNILRIYLDRKDYRACRETLAQLEIVAATDPAMLAQLGDMWIEVQDFEQAKKIYTASLAADPTQTDALFGLAYLHWRVDEFIEARELLIKVYQLDPQRLDAKNLIEQIDGLQAGKPN